MTLVLPLLDPQCRSLLVMEARILFVSFSRVTIPTNCVAKNMKLNNNAGNICAMLVPCRMLQFQPSPQEPEDHGWLKI